MDLIVVVDPDYGDRLEETAETSPTWIVASTTNDAACERRWNTLRIDDFRAPGAVTSYDAAATHDPFAKDKPLVNLLYILPTIIEHHGEITDDRVSFPRGFVLRVIGLALESQVIIALEEFRFSSFVAVADGFEATM